MSNIQLYSHQSESVKKVYHSWSQGSLNCVLVEPTGAGKTFIKAQFARDSFVKREVTIVFAHRDVLLEQISLSLAKMGVPHGFIAQNKIIKQITDSHLTELGQSFFDEDSPIIVASVDTYLGRLKRKELDELLPLVEFWMLDESHHLLEENKWGKCVNSLPNARGLGVTATPIRSDGKGLGRGRIIGQDNEKDNDGLFDSMIVGSKMGDLISAGFLSSYKIFIPPTKLNIEGMKVTSSGDWNQKELAKRTDKADITGDTVDQYLKLANGKQAIVFCVNIEHSNHVAEEFNKAGIIAASLSSKTKFKERARSIQEFKLGNIKILVNCNLFDEGFDVPAVSCVIMLRKTDSYGLFKQQFGRLLRVIEGKEYGILIDQVGNVQRHCIYGTPHDDPEWTLERTKDRYGDSEKSEARVCPECFNYYTPAMKNKFVCSDCDHEETALETDAAMQKFIIDRSDLVEMNVEFIETLMNERKKVDLSPLRLRQNMTKAGMKDIVVNSAVNNHTKRQFAQNRLRKEIQSFGIIKMQKEGWSLKTFQMYFEKEFKINILKAQVLSEKLTLKLLEEIKNAKT